MDLQPTDDRPPRRGVVAVVAREEKLLVIRRSQLVRAPGMFCFPGGAIEEGESEADAVARELWEELAVRSRAVRQLWTSITRSNVALSWWLAEIDLRDCPQCNPAEVETCHWLAVDEIRTLPNLLASNHEFLTAWEQGVFAIDGLRRTGRLTSSSPRTAD